MGMIDGINAFVDTMIAEQGNFENMQNEISRREKDALNILNHLANRENEVIATAKGEIAQTGDEDIQGIFNYTADEFSRAMLAVNQKIDETVKGMTFIEGFEKHFTVSVFGKVKAGKSYIGNFVMGQPVREAGISSSYDKLEDLTVKVYDRGKMYEQGKLSTADEEKECNGQEFYVNNNEATSTIQLVNIGGMCWFDTPGIGSVTLENEELAKEYVKNTDLVIFACNSDAAGTRQEFAEMRELRDMDKPILLLLTQSDAYDYDVDEDGEEISVLIPKSEKDRQDQEAYMLETLREQGMEDILKHADILTVSALLATEALKNNDEVMYEQSNMGKLLDVLTNITKNEAADMKRNTPKSRINEMVNSIISDLSKTSDEIIKTCSSIEKNKMELSERKDPIIEQIKGEVHLKVLEIIGKAKTKVEKEGKAVSEEELSEKINKAAINTIQKVCIEAALTQNKAIPNMEIQLTGIGDMKMRQDRISYEHISVKSVPRAPEGILEKLGQKIFQKTYYTTELNTELRDSVFDIGVNDSEVAQNIILQLETIFSATLDRYIEFLAESYYKPVEELQKSIIKEINTAISSLEGLRMEC